MMQAWKMLSRETVLDDGRFLRVERHTVQVPDGRVIPDWYWVVTPNYAVILLMTDSDEFLCFRQMKYSYEGTSLATFGGYIEPGEDPLSAAKRELLEETGYEANEWNLLGQYRVDANRGAGIAHLFLARGARQIAERDADDLEEQELVRLSREELHSALMNGEFKILAWAANVALALEYLNR